MTAVKRRNARCSCEPAPKRLMTSVSVWQGTDVSGPYTTVFAVALPAVVALPMMSTGRLPPPDAPEGPIAKLIWT